MMKLRLLVVAAGLVALPTMGHAQSMSKDSMMMKDSMKMKHSDMKMKHSDMMKDSMMMKDSSKKSMPMKKHTRMSKAKMQTGEAHESMKTERAERMAPMSDGTTCPMKCPSSKGAAGLTGPQFLALQQELRDRGCGNAHVTGWLDAPTRHAIANCSKKMNVANNAGALLVALNIGYSDSDVSGAKM